MQWELGFVGAGHMAEAIARAAIDKGVLTPQQMIASDPSDQRRSVFSGLGIQTVSDNQQVIGQSKQVLLAVKPQSMPQAAADVGRHGGDDQVILSIMAGVSTQKLADAMSAGRPPIGRPRIIRIMPNTPLQVGFGMAGIAMGVHTRGGDEQLATRLFGAAGRVIMVDESQLDAVTALSGSGPAYVFYLAEAMQRAAGELGLAQHADVLVQQTILGAAHLLALSDQGPATLRRQVTSPGGTTEAAIGYLDEHQTADVIAGAIKAARERSVQLGK